MKTPNIHILPSRPDVTDQWGHRAYIPTFGHIASSLDIYRTAAIIDVKDRPNSWCFTDSKAVGALGRIIDGPISSAQDIEHAESALRAILLHDFVEITVPCVKALNGNHLSYKRFDNLERNEAAFAAMNTTPCRDSLIALEMVEIKNGEFVRSSNQSSALIGCAEDDLCNNYQKMIKTGADVVSSLTLQLEASSYFTVDDFVSNSGTAVTGFIGSLYKRIHKPWLEVAQATPSSFIDLKLPPFISIVLSRAKSRNDIPEVLAELRNELNSVRKDLNELNRLVDLPMSQAELHDRVQKMNQSFDAIVPEALMTESQRTRRRIVSVFNFLAPLRQIYSLAADPLSADPVKFIEIYESSRDAVLKNKKIVSRSVTATKFSELLRVNSIPGIIRSHFTVDELASLKGF